MYTEDRGGNLLRNYGGHKQYYTDTAQTTWDVFTAREPQTSGLQPLPFIIYDYPFSVIHF